MTEESTWEDALTSGKFVKFINDESKTLKLTNARLERERTLQK